MSRMHSRKKGKSGSKRPYGKKQPKWVEYSLSELEALTVKLAKKGETSSNIGVILRDQYGIPNVKQITKKRVTQMLEGKKIKKELPEDLMNLIKKAVKLVDHQATNPRDTTAKRGAQLTESKIKRLVKYYVREGRIPLDWEYNLEKAKLLVK